MSGPRFAPRVTALLAVGLALCTLSLACALLVGLEDKEAFPDADSGEAGLDGSVSATDGPIATSEAGPIGVPQVFVSGQAKPWGVAVDDAYVYWTNEGDETVTRAPKSGGAPTVLARDQLEPHQILVDATNIIWHNTNLANRPYNDAGPDFVEIANLPKSSIGKDAGPIKIGTTKTESKLRDLSMAKVADNQLWTAYDTRVTRFRRDSPAAQKIAANALLAKQPTAVAVDDANFYWFLQQPFEIWRIAKDFDTGVDDAGAVLATLQGNPEIAGMVADGTALYMVSSGGSVLRVPTGAASDAGAAPALLAMGQAFPKAITQDDKYVYITRSSADDGASQGLVVMIAKAGGESTIIAQGLDKPRGIAVDLGADGSRTVYWVTYGDGTIRRVRVK